MNLNYVNQLEQEIRTLEGVLYSDISKSKSTPTQLLSTTDREVIKKMIKDKKRLVDLNLMQD